MVTTKYTGRTFKGEYPKDILLYVPFCKIFTYLRNIYQLFRLAGAVARSQVKSLLPVHPLRGSGDSYGSMTLMG